MRNQPVERCLRPRTPESTPWHRYDAELAGRIERRWQQRWRELRTFEAPNPVGDLAPADPSDVPTDKLFVQDMFPYPSGAGLHVGHPLGYIATDVFARFHRMNGRNVLHTAGIRRVRHCPPSSMRCRPAPTPG